MPMGFVLQIHGFLDILTSYVEFTMLQFLDAALSKSCMLSGL